MRSAEASVRTSVAIAGSQRRCDAAKWSPYGSCAAYVWRKKKNGRPGSMVARSPSTTSAGRRRSKSVSKRWKPDASPVPGLTHPPPVLAAVV